MSKNLIFCDICGETFPTANARNPKFVIRVHHTDYCQIIRVFYDEFGVLCALFTALLDSHKEFEIRFSELEVA